MKKLFLLLLPLTILTIWLALKPVVSVTAVTETATDSGQESGESDEVTQNLKELIDKIVKEKKEKIQGAIDDLSKRKTGFIGQVGRITAESVTISNHKGTQIIPIDSSVDLVKSGRGITLDDVAVGDWLILMGYLEEDTFQPKRIVVSSESLDPDPHVVMFATVSQLTRSNLTVIPRNNQNGERTLTLGRNVSYQDYQGEDAARTDFKTNSQVLVVGFEQAETDDSTTQTTKVIVTTLRALAPFNNGSEE